MAGRYYSPSDLPAGDAAPVSSRVVLAPEPAGWNRPATMLDYAIAGHAGVDFDTLNACRTSDCHMAWIAGRALAAAGMNLPRKVRAGRGYSVWTDDRRWLIDFAGNGTAVPA